MKKMQKTIAIGIASLFLIPLFFIMPTFVPTAGASTTWYNNDWLYSKKITIDHTKVAGDLTNFPVLISRTDTDFKKAQSDGDDFIFVSVDNTTTYNHEIEKWDSNTGELIAWVNVTSLSSTVDTVIWMYYGNPACSSQQNAAGTWSADYRLVTHMNDLTTSTVKDSTSYGKIYTKHTANEPIERTTGKIGNCQEYNIEPAHNYIRTTTHGGVLDLTGSTGTFSFWFYCDGDSAGDDLELLLNNNGNNYRIFVRSSLTFAYESSVNGKLDTGIGITTGTWLYVTSVVTGGNIYLYVNNATVYNHAYSFGSTGVKTFEIGNNANLNHAVDGKMDEIRVSTNAKTASWISTEYNNANATSAFASFGTENNGGVKTWYHSDWKYCKQITINHSYVGGTLTNFPVLVSRTDTDLKHAQSDGDDFIFIASDNLTKYNHEIEKWDSASGILVAWVNITSLSSTTDTILYLYYGNPTCSNQQTVEGTWDSNYVTVQHMTGAALGNILDSTAGNHDATSAGGTPDYNSVGKIGYGINFDGVNEYVDLDNSNLFTPATGLTLECWAQDATHNFNDDGLMGKMHISPADYGWRLLFTGGATPSQYSMVVYGTGGGYIKRYASVTAGNPTDTNFHYFTGTWDGTTSGNGMKLYIDSVRKDDTTADSGTFTAIKTSAAKVSIGDESEGGSYTTWDGVIDEVRISNVARSTDWMNTTFNTINSTSAFTTFGNEQTTWYDTSFLYRQKITINHNKVDADLTNFPVLVKTTMDTTKVQSNGNDILFTSSAGVKLNHEIETYNSTSGELVSWVNVTSVSMSAPDTYIYVYWGNAVCPSQQNVAGTWDSNYQMVQHMKDTTTSTITDSLNINNMTKIAVNRPQVATGKIGDGQTFNVANPDYIYKDSGVTGIGGYSTYSLTFWFKLETTGIDRIPYCLGNAGLGDSLQRVIFSAANKIEFGIGESGGLGARYWRSTNTFTDTASFHSFVATYNAGTIHVYIDGSEIAGSIYYGTYTGVVCSPTIYLRIGNMYHSGVPPYNIYSYSGSLDEVRVSKSDRSSTWFSTEYKNQNDSANFTIFGSIDGGGTPASNNAPNTPTGLSPTARQTSTSVNIYATGSDPDGGSLYLYFYNDDTKAEIGHVNISNNTQGTVSWAGLTRGNTYTFYARGYDGTLWGTNSTTCTFTVNSLPVCTGFMTENLTDPTHIINILPYFSWSYSDGDSDTQAQYEVEVGTTNNSNNIWDPSIVTSSNHYAIYAGSALTRGQLYYVRVRVYDGYEWSEW